MTNHEKIKELPLEKLAKFLTKYGIGKDVGDNWCRKYCEHRLPNYGCKTKECIYQEEEAVIAWLKENAKDNEQT